MGLAAAQQPRLWQCPDRNSWPEGLCSALLLLSPSQSPQASPHPGASQGTFSPELGVHRASQWLCPSRIIHPSEDLAGKAMAKPCRVWELRAPTLALVLSPAGGSGDPSRLLWHCAPQCATGLCIWGTMKAPKPEFTMPTMVLRVEVGADSCPVHHTSSSLPHLVHEVSPYVLKTLTPCKEAKSLKIFSSLGPGELQVSFAARTDVPALAS